MTFWVALFGGFALLVVAGAAFAWLNRGHRRAAWGRRFVGVVLAVFSVGTILWIVMWGFTPFSLEGLWIYPLAIVTAVVSFILLRSRRRSAWKQPSEDVVQSGR